MFLKQKKEQCLFAVQVLLSRDELETTNYADLADQVRQAFLGVVPHRAYRTEMPSAHMMTFPKDASSSKVRIEAEYYREPPVARDPTPMSLESLDIINR